MNLFKCQDRRAQGEDEGSASAAQDNRKGPGLALVGSALATGAVYLCHYTFVGDLSPASPSALAAALGLIGAFCVLTAAAIGGIRQLVINSGNRFRPVLSLVICVISMAALICLMVGGVSR